MIKADAIMGNFTSIVIPQRAPNGCAYTSSQSTQGTILLVLFTAPISCGTSTADPSPRSTGKSKSKTVIIAASVAGGIVLIAVVTATLIFLFKKGKCSWLKQATDDESAFVV